MKFKKSSEMDVEHQREVLHHAIENRVLLKTIIKKNLKNRDDSESDTDSDSQKNYKGNSNSYVINVGMIINYDCSSGKRRR